MKMIKYKCVVNFFIGFGLILNIVFVVVVFLIVVING